MIDILLATYNGARFLREQLDSLWGQTVQDWTLWVRDDGSSDETLNIAQAYQLMYPGKVKILEGGSHVGAARNFAALFGQSTAPYVMFCDQDDIWLPEKIALTLTRMKALEAQHGDIPLLVHTDMSVVDEKLRPLASSFALHMQLAPEHIPLQRLLVQNVATGTAMMINRALADKVKTIPEAARMHDMWIALVASLFGRIEWLPQSTALYRQHGGNRIGAHRNLPQFSRLQNILRGNAGQAKELYDRYGNLIPADECHIIERFLALSAQSFPGWNLYQQGYRRTPWHQNLPFIAVPKTGS